MKKSNLILYAIPIIVLTGISTTGCDQSRENEQSLIGKWNAHWETQMDSSFSGIEGKNLHMNGKINFHQNGTVEIAAYGYNGCIFSDDTLINTLKWKISDSELRFIDEGDSQGLPYVINNFTSDQLDLTLLEDIHLTLLRN